MSTNGEDTINLNVDDQIGNQSAADHGNSQSANSLIMAELRGLRTSQEQSWSSLSSTVNAISTRVDRLSEKVSAGPSAASRSSENGSGSWADDSRSPPPRQPRWQDEDDFEEEAEGDNHAGYVELQGPRR